MPMPTPPDHPALTTSHTARPITSHQLAVSYRFDAELAALLTNFQYAADGLTLEAAQERSLPASAHDAPTPGVAAVFETDASVVLITYDDRSHRMVNPIETAIVTALAEAVVTPPAHPHQAPSDTASGATPLAEGSPASATGNTTPPQTRADPTATPSVGVVTPHNAQRGALEATLPERVTANTVEKYQGGERDLIAVSATVSDPEFARREEQFILNPRRLLVAISRARYRSVVVCSRALFEVTPRDAERLDIGPLWARLFALITDSDPDPTWMGQLGEFTSSTATEHADTTLRVYA
jgi:hypothetical protein